MTTIALFGAAGKIGTRIANRLRHASEFDTLYVESGEVGLARLAANGLTATEKETACGQTDVAILAVPDTVLGTVAHDIVPLCRAPASADLLYRYSRELLSAVIAGYRC